MHECAYCGKAVPNNKKYCNQKCWDTHKLVLKTKEVEKLKKEVTTLQQRITEQDNLWENLMADIIEEGLPSSHIRWWMRKLVMYHNISNESRVLSWLSGLLGIIEAYTDAKEGKDPDDKPWIPKEINPSTGKKQKTA